MMRRGMFKYTYYANDSGELYDLAADPDEVNKPRTPAGIQLTTPDYEAEFFPWHTPDANESSNH
jgi:hypothetical protein